MRITSSWRADFPQLLAQPQLHYLDSAATSLKPSAVLEATNRAMGRDYAPIHRGLYPSAENATDLYEGSRHVLASFLGARDDDALVFTRSATESINMVARGWLEPRLAPGDEVWVSELEHHANYLPWQQVCRRHGARLRILPIDETQSVNLRQLPELTPKVKLIALTAVSNVLGVALPVAEIASRAHRVGAAVLIDAAQAVGHQRVNFAELGCDFLVASGHKMLGPTGIGMLLGRQALLEQTEPLLLGGGMVDVATGDDPVWAALPAKLEAGSPNFVGAVGLGAAAEYLLSAGIENIHRHVAALTKDAANALSELPGVSVYGLQACDSAHGIVSFNVGGVHPHDVGQIAGEHGVALRAGHHCCQPLMRALGVEATARASFALYNDSSDIDALTAAVEDVVRIFGATA